MKRLFIPLCTEPFNWFVSGEKEWELRRRSSKYNKDQIIIGDTVELRRGYVARNGVCWGKVTDCREYSSLKEVFSEIPYQKIIRAGSLAEATDYVTNLMGLSYDGRADLIAIRIERIEMKGEILFDNRYLPMILAKEKTTTIRQGIRSYPEGFYNAFNTSRTKCILIKVIKTETTTFEQLKDDNAKTDGYLSVEQLKQDLLKFYPDLNSGSPMTIVTLGVE